MIPVNLIDNVLRPLLMGRGLETPIIVILIGVIGGTISLGLTGLFLGPIILAVIWELLMAWIRERETLRSEKARSHFHIRGGDRVVKRNIVAAVALEERECDRALLRFEAKSRRPRSQTRQSLSGFGP